jgi:hypothetical protein
MSFSFEYRESQEYVVPKMEIFRVVVGKKNSPTVAHTGRKRRPKWVPSAWGYNWAPLSLWVISTETWSSRLGVGRGANNPTP